MKNTVLAAGIAAALTVAAVVPAAAGELPLTLNAGVSHWYFSSDRDLENMTAPMAGLEWAFNDNWAAELSYADDDANDELRVIEFPRIRGGKPFNIDQPWFEDLLSGIGQAKGSKEHVEH